MLDNLLKSIPPVTRTITIIRFIGAILVYTNTINQFDIYFNTSKIMSGQIWRIITSLFFFKSINFSVFYKSIITLYISTSIEKNGFKRGSIDFLYFNCINIAIITFLAVFFGISSLSGIYIYSLYYYFGRIYTQRFIIINFIPIRAPYVLWFILAIQWISADPSLYNNIAGIFVGHCLFFMFNIYQDLGMCRQSDRKLFDTPQKFVDIVSPLFSVRNRARQQFDQDDLE